MKINLKNLSRDTASLKYIQGLINNMDGNQRMWARRLDKIIRFQEEIERDLEMSGECIIELDKSRLESIAERDKMINFMNQADEP